MSILLGVRDIGMDFKGVIDFVKYTLALTAACFVYSLEKLVPQPTLKGRWLVLGLLAVFVMAAIVGILIFAASTAALHGDQQRTKRLKPWIARAGYAHFFLLGVGLLVLTGMLVGRVLTEAPKASQNPCVPAGATGIR